MQRIEGKGVDYEREGRIRVVRNTLWIPGHGIEIYLNAKEITTSGVGRAKFLSLQAPGPRRLGKRLVGSVGRAGRSLPLEGLTSIVAI
jgi:hypothetical protein